MHNESQRKEKRNKKKRDYDKEARMKKQKVYYENKVAPSVKKSAVE